MPIDVRNRLQPALLDRLTDDDPDQRKEAESHRVMSKAQLRQAVLRDLGALVQLGAAARPHRAEPLPDARRERAQLRPAAAVGAARVQARRQRRSRRRSGRRSCASSRASCPTRCRSRALEAASVLDTHNVIEFEIRGHLWSQPVPLEILLRTQLDLEAGQVEVRDVGGGARAASRLADDERRIRPWIRVCCASTATSSRHLREVGAEFAREFPKIAARLGMEGMEVTDPYVERLLEGLRLPDRARPAQARGRAAAADRPPARIDVPELPGADAVDAGRASRRRPGRPEPRQGLRRAARQRAPLRGAARPGHALRVHDGARRDAVADRAGQRAVLQPRARPRRWRKLPQLLGTRGGLRIRLRCGGGVKFNQLGLDRLAFYIARRRRRRVSPARAGARLGQRHARARRRGERRGRRRAAMARQRQRSRARLRRRRSAAAGVAARASPAIGCCRKSRRCRSGCCSSRSAISPSGSARVASDEVELVVLLQRGDAGARGAGRRATASRSSARRRSTCSTSGSTASRSAPASWEYHVVPDRTRPMDYEVHSIAVGHRLRHRPRRPAGVLAAVRDLSRRIAPSEAEAHGYYTVRREPRLLSARQKQQRRALVVHRRGGLSSRSSIRAMRRIAKTSASCRSPRWVTNRDLPTLLPRRGERRRRLVVAARFARPGGARRCPARPDAAGHPAPGRASSAGASSATSRSTTSRSSARRRNAPPRRCERCSACTRRPRTAAGRARSRACSASKRGPSSGGCRSRGRSTFGTRRGDRRSSSTSSPSRARARSCSRSVLERFFARHAAINSFTQLTLRTLAARRGDALAAARRPARDGL